MTDILIEFEVGEKGSPLQVIEDLTDKLRMNKEDNQIDSFALHLVTPRSEFDYTTLHIEEGRSRKK